MAHPLSARRVDMLRFEACASDANGESMAMNIELSYTNEALPDLKQVRVLVVEDEAMIALMIEQMLIDFGCEVVGMVGELQEAVAAVDKGGFDVVILDLNLNGQQSYPVAEALTAKGLPFVFSTGYGARGVVDSYCSNPTLQKPFFEAELRQALQAAIASGQH